VQCKVQPCKRKREKDRVRKSSRLGKKDRVRKSSKFGKRFLLETASIYLFNYFLTIKTVDPII